MNQSAMLARFAREADIDVFLLAGRYTLLDQGALDELLPLCLERGIGVLVGGVMNSGVLADPRRRAAASTTRRRRRRSSSGRGGIGEVCARHDVPLRAAAVQFPLAHPAVAALVAGVRTRRPPRRVPGARCGGRSRQTCGPSSAPRASSGPTPRRPPEADEP